MSDEILVGLGVPRINHRVTRVVNAEAIGRRDRRMVQKECRYGYAVAIVDDPLVDVVAARHYARQRQLVRWSRFDEQATPDFDVIREGYAKTQHHCLHAHQTV